MKRLFKFFVPAAVAAIALVSCEQEVQVPSEPDTISIRVKASADALANVDTKTYIDTYEGQANTILWGTGEYMKLALKAGDNDPVFATSTNDSADLFNGEPVALFEFSVSPASADSYEYMGLYPASAAVDNNNTNAANYKVKLPNIQNATAASYDPAAYIMVAKPEIYDAVQVDWNASFRRATALNQITLTGINADIVSVEFTAASSVKLAGSRHINLTTGADSDIYSGENVVTVNYASALAAANDKVVWFTSWDATIAEGSTLKIVAKSATKSYTRTITAREGGILFKEGYLNKMTVNMSSADVDDLVSYEGDYVILAKNNTTYYALKDEASSTRIASENYTGSLDSYTGLTDDPLIWTIEASGNNYTVKSKAGSNYIGWTSGNSADLVAEANYDADQCLMGISESDGIYTIYVVADNSRILARNTSNAYFAFYSGTQYKDLVLVPATVDNRERVATPTFSPVAGQVAENTTVTISTETQGATIYYTVDGTDPTSESTQGTSVTVNASMTIKAIAVKNDMRDSEIASAEYTVAGSTPEPETGWIETDIADLTGSDVFVIVGNGATALPHDNGSSSAPGVPSVTISNGKITSTVTDAMKWNISGDSSDGYVFYPNGDDTQWLYCTATNNGVRVGTNANKAFVLDGDYLKNVATSRYLSIYNNQDWRCYGNTNNNPQAITFYKYSDGSNPTVATPTFSIVGSDVSIACSTDGATIYYTVDGTPPSAQSSVYSAAISLLGSQQKTIKAFATKTDYEDSEVAAKTYYAVNVDATENGTVTAQPFAAEGDVVSLTVTPHSGYTLDALSVTDSGDNAVSVSSNQFTMPASPVTVSATFASGVQPNDGSLDHPYTVAEALEIIDGYSDKEKSSSQVYVSGIVANVGSYNSTYNSVTYDISDDGQNSNTLNVYSGKFVANTNFSSNEQIEAGDEVIVYGYLYLYGSTKEMYQNNYIYSLNGITTLPTITKTDITGVDAAGVNNATKTVSFANNDGWTASVTADGTIVTSASISGTTITYSVAANSGDARTGSIIVALSKSGRAYVSATISVSQLAGNGNTSTTETITSGTFSGDTNSLSMTTASGITISQLKNNGTNCNTTYNTVSTLRVYRANQMQFTGKTFTKIEMYYTGNYSGAAWTVVAGGGTVSIDTTNKKVVWTNTNGASTVTLQNSTSSGTNTQLRTTQFYFEY